jgi:hypothetical protein
LPSSSSSSAYSLDVSGKTTGEDDAKTEEDEDRLPIDLGVDLEDNLFAAMTDTEASLPLHGEASYKLW